MLQFNDCDSFCTEIEAACLSRASLFHRSCSALSGWKRLVPSVHPSDVKMKSREMCLPCRSREREKGWSVDFRLVFHHSHASMYVFSLCFRPFIKTFRNFVSVFALRSVFCFFAAAFSLSVCLESKFFSAAFSNFQIVKRKIFADEFHRFLPTLRK